MSTRPNSYLDAASVPVEQNQNWIRNNTLSKEKVIQQPKSVEGIGQYGGQEVRGYKLTPESLSHAVPPGNGQELKWTDIKQNASVQPLRQIPLNKEEVLARYNALRQQYGSPPIRQSQLYPTAAPKFRLPLKPDEVNPNEGGISHIVSPAATDSQWLSRENFTPDGSLGKRLPTVGVLGSQYANGGDKD